MTIQIEDTKIEAMKAALKQAIPKVSRDPHGDALQQLLGLLGEDSAKQLHRARARDQDFAKQVHRAHQDFTKQLQRSHQESTVEAHAADIRAHLRKK